MTTVDPANRSTEALGVEPSAEPDAPPTVPPTHDEFHSIDASKETLEDYTLRFAPRSYRRWGTGVVATSALGGIAYLADFSIGANIGIDHGTTNACGASCSPRSSSSSSAFPSPTTPPATTSTWI